MWSPPRFLPSALVLLAAACVGERKVDPIPGNLVAGAKVETSGVPNTDRLADGRGAHEGDFWDTVVTARFDRADAHVTWDLGAEKPIRCALVQGDNNDTYHLRGSADGKEWKTLWDAAPATGAGMRTRAGSFDAKARYLRLSASGGDTFYSVAELVAFTDCPPGWPKFDLPRADPASADGVGSVGGVWTISLALFAIALVVFIVLTRRKPEPAPVATSGSPDQEK